MLILHQLNYISITFSYHRLIITKQLQKNKTTQDLNELENEFRIPDTQKQKKGKRKSGLKKMNLGRDASDVEVGTAESATLFDAIDEWWKRKQLESLRFVFSVKNVHYCKFEICV